MTPAVIAWPDTVDTVDTVDTERHSTRTRNEPTRIPTDHELPNNGNTSPQNVHASTCPPVLVRKRHDLTDRFVISLDTPPRPVPNFLFSHRRHPEPPFRKPPLAVARAFY